MAVERQVNTTFRTIDNATGPLGAIAAASSRVGGALLNASAAYLSFQAIQGLAGSLSGFIELESHAEGTRMAITGALRAFGVSGEAMADINARFAAGTNEWRAAQHTAFMEAQDDATRVIGEITRRSDSLPGSAEDYVEVFRTALPGALEAGMTDLSQIGAMTADFTAVASANQVQASQSGQDLLRMLQGHASMLVPTWRHLAGVMHRTAGEFNAMNPTQRVAEINRAIELYRPLLLEFNSTWDSIYGTTTGTFKRLGMAIGMPVFDSIKHALRGFNDLLAANEARVVSVGVAISTYIASGIDKAVVAAAAFGAKLMSVGAMIQAQPWFRALTHLGQNFGAAAGRLMSSNGNRTGVASAGIGMMAQSALGPLGLLIGPLTVFAQNTIAVNQAMTSLVSIWGHLGTMLEPFVIALAAVNEAVGGFLTNAITGIMSGLEMIIGPLSQFGVLVLETAGAIADELRPFLMRLGSAVGNLAEGIGTVLGPVIRILTLTLGYLVTKFREYLMPVIDVFIVAISMVIHGLGDLLKWIGNLLGEVVRDAELNSQAPARGLVMNRELDDAMRESAEATTAAAAAQRRHNNAAAHTPAHRGGNNTHNDFRNSRFDINQRFAEGFEPDRMALAFSHDLERLANQRLQSGLEPVFGIH